MHGTEWANDPRNLQDDSASAVGTLYSGSPCLDGPTTRAAAVSSMAGRSTVSLAPGFKGPNRRGGRYFWPDITIVK